MRKYNTGITLIELLVTVMIISVLVAIGAPNILTASRSVTTANALDSVYFTLRQARSYAIRGNSDILIDMQSGSNWCIGLTDQANCNCATANSCTVDGVNVGLTGEDFPNVSLSTITFADEQVSFDNTRGLPNRAGSVNLSDGEREIRLNMNALGRVEICLVSGDMRDYPSCA